MNSPRASFTSLAASALLVLAFAPACEKKDPTAGLVVDASAAIAVPVVDAGVAAVADVSQCPGCQLAPTPTWEFAGIYSDPGCTAPLAQIATPACAPVAAVGPASITFVDAFGARRAGESAQVTLTEAPAVAARFRKAGNACVRANETATDITPAGCAGQRVCRDANGTLACAGCRTFANGCPDFEETRMYASFADTAKPGGAAVNGNVARLLQCCNALKGMANAPEIAAVVAQCTAIANAAGPNGTAPELGTLRTMMAGKQIPAVCAGF